MDTSREARAPDGGTPGRYRRFGRALALTFAAVLAAFAVGEFLLRGVVGGPARFLYGASFVDRQIDWQVQYGVDESGQRKVCRPSGADTSYTRKIALIGDSFAFGQGVADCAELGSMVQSLEPDIRIENFGLIGIGLREYRIIIRDNIDRSFDKAFLLIYGNDVFEHAGQISLFGGLADVSSLFALLRKVKRARIVQTFLKPNADEGESAQQADPSPFSNVKSILQADPSYFYKTAAPDGRSLARFAAEFNEVLEQLARVVGRRNIYVAVVPEGTTVSERLRNFVAQGGGQVAPFGEPGRAYESIRDMAIDNGIVFLETYELFEDCGDKCYYPRDLHWTEAGHALMASVIAEALSGKGVD